MQFDYVPSQFGFVRFVKRDVMRQAKIERITSIMSIGFLATMMILEPMSAGEIQGGAALIGVAPF